MRKVIATLVLIGLVGYASALCECLRKQTTQKDIWEKSDVVAHVKVDEVQIALHLDNTQVHEEQKKIQAFARRRSSQDGEDKAKELQKDAIYHIKFVKVFKPTDSENSSLPLVMTTPFFLSDCGVPLLIKGGEYLISAKNWEGPGGQEQLRIDACNNFPLSESGPALVSPPMWSAVTPELKKKLESEAF